MQTKILEVRDEGTFIPVLCVNMAPDALAGPEVWEAQRHYLRRCGYPCDGRPNIAVTNLNMDGGRATNDPYGWTNRTMAVAHQHILDNWAYLKDGDVVDVQHILGETPVAKVSERFAKVGA